VEHLARPDERPLASQVEAAVRRLVAEGLDGDVLVFLPGAAEIRRAQEACARVAGESDLLVVALHGELPAAEQDRAVRPAGRRKVILSTNVAETSVTIEGVVAVIDSGLARVASHSPWSGLPTLNVGRVSQASAAQRAGRAGRTRPGRCLRLYTAQDFNARPAHEAPEVERLDLAEPALELHANGVENLRAFGWFEAPPAHALDAAEALLQKLGALDAAGRVTETGRAMLRLPVHPRLARLVVEGERRGVGSAARVVAALVGERDIREREVLSDAASRGPARARRHGPSDLLELLDLFREAARLRFAPERLRASGVNPTAARNVERVARQLRRLTRDGARSGGGGEQAKEDRREQTQGARAEPKEDRRVPSKVERGGSSFRLEPSGESSAVEALSEAGEAELLISILAGYPDRVARRRASNEGEGGRVELLLAGGGSAQLAPESVVRQSEFMVAVDAEQRRDAGGRKPVGRGAGGTLVRLASACEPEWLLDLFPESVGESIEARWNAQAERVEVLSRLVYEGLVLAESRANEAGGAEAARLLAEAALAAGPGAFADADALERFLARVEFAARTFPEADFPRLEDEDVRAALVELCEGRRSFAELREAARAGTLFDALRRKLNAEQTRLLASGAPERVTLGGGRQVRVNYERERPPWVASRLQDFFGMDAGPRVGAGRVPLLLHLLAPNQRPVQLTSDLAGFWQRHYPQVRRELSRRYPRHAWPEDPLKPETSEGGKKR
ncbi:MAG TPA: ATP-dependent helicase C-terminal domain-containing protein, partial [Pyrinomonadaceae bacterium]|nr:ATP-dependent helicase C-terminal domain-containing protein [Pyrinomonadaceae bacterium]